MEWLTGFITGILASFAFGSFWFWVLLLTSGSFITGCVNRCSSGWAFFWTLILGVPIAYNLWGVNGKVVFGVIIGYLIVGVVYSANRWKGFVRGKVSDFKYRWSSEIALLGNDKALRDQKYEDTEHSYQRAWRSLEGETTASRNKEQLTLWTFYWPFSLLWKLTGGLVETVYDVASGWYNDIQKKALADVPRHNA